MKKPEKYRIFGKNGEEERKKKKKKVTFRVSLSRAKNSVLQHKSQEQNTMGHVGCWQWPPQ